MFCLGGQRGVSGTERNEILEYVWNDEGYEWVVAGNMMSRRSGHAVSIVDIDEYWGYCQ